MDLQCDSHIYGQKSFCEKANHIADNLFDKNYACIYLPTYLYTDDKYSCYTDCPQLSG